MSNCKGSCLYSVSEYCSDFHIVLVPNYCSVLWYKQIVGHFRFYTVFFQAQSILKKCTLSIQHSLKRGNNVYF